MGSLSYSGNKADGKRFSYVETLEIGCQQDFDLLQSIYDEGDKEQKWHVVKTVYLMYIGCESSSEEVHEHLLVTFGCTGVQDGEKIVWRSRNLTRLFS